MTGRIGLDRTARQQATVLGAAVVLTLGGGVWTAIVRVDHGRGPDTISSAVGATLTRSEGSRLAVRGDRLAVGDELVTDASGRADVDVPDGRLVLGPDTGVRIMGTRTVELLHGTAGLRLVHATAALAMQSGTLTASVTQSGAVERVVRDYRVTVAALAGGAEVSAVDGSGLSLPAFAEVDVPGVVLPASPVPVQSLDHDADSVDTALAPDLVRSDIALDHLAAQVDADSVARTALRPASFEASALPAAVSHPSELALTRAMGQASAGDHAAQAQRAVALRAAGAAWAIVAADLHVTAEQLRPIIDEMLATPRVRSLVPSLATQALPTAGVAAPAPSGGASPAPSPHPGSSTVPATPGANPSGAPRPTPAPPTSAPASDPVQELVAVVTRLLGGSPRPGPSPSPSPGGGGLLCPVVGLLGLC